MACSARQMEIEFAKVRELRPHPRNPRVHPDSALERLTKSIEEFGWTNPILVSEDGYILAGHARLKAAEKVGLAEVPIIRLPLKGKQAEAYMIADNRTAELTEWDMPKLKDLLEELDIDDFDVTVTGFSDEEIEDLMTQFHVPEEGLTDDDEIPEKVETICKTGDLWQLGNHRLLCGDAIKKEDVERLMQGEKADMVFIDPPYAVDYGRDQEELQRLSGGKFSKTRKSSRIQGDNLSIQETAENLWKPAFGNMFAVAEDNCSFYMTMCQGGDQMMMMMMMMMSQHWQIKHELIWVKSSAVFSMGRLDYDYQHEPILFGWKKKHEFYGNGQFTKSVWEIPKPNKSDLHPTMKPIALIENALQNSSRLNDNILDLFGGSGSTLIACEKLGRRCYMMEIDEHYCDVIRTRWEAFTGKKAVKLDGG